MTRRYPEFIARLKPAETSELVQAMGKAKRELLALGIEESLVNANIQNDIDDVYERKSVKCAYEQDRFRRILWRTYGEEAEDISWVTYGNPCYREPAGKVLRVRPANVLRHFSDLGTILRVQGYSPRGCAIFEHNVILALDEDPWVEPHYHGLVFGVPVEVVREAGRVNVPGAVTARRRPFHAAVVKTADDLANCIDYLTKFRPVGHPQYRDESGNLPTGKERRLPKEIQRPLEEFLLLRPISSLLTSLRDELRPARLPLTMEMMPARFGMPNSPIRGRR
ncbi:MAG: hypothetical protein KJ587_13690 [Alphaproteobacteria bacterium]|nr:hypothetical protein [Alphaproteobacteria bacterium]